jgi:hypothetical protein
MPALNGMVGGTRATRMYGPKGPRFPHGPGVVLGEGLELAGGEAPFRTWHTSPPWTRGSGTARRRSGSSGGRPARPLAVANGTGRASPPAAKAAKMRKRGVDAPHQRAGGAFRPFDFELQGSLSLRMRADPKGAQCEGGYGGYTLRNHTQGIINDLRVTIDTIRRAPYADHTRQ